MFPLHGALAVVTGAGSGIGAALARALAARGTHLALVDIDGEGLEATRQSLGADIRASMHRMDVTDGAAIASLPALVEDVHGAPADILVNNAGVALQGRFDEVSQADFDWLLGINLHAPIRLTRAFLPSLMTRPKAQIVNVSSIFGIIGPPGQAAYSTAKFGLRGFSEALRHELEHGPVGVTVVHPGGVSTSIARNARTTLSESREKAEKRLRSIEALLRMPAAEAGEIIAHGIEKRRKRVLIGRDARIVDILQRLFPASYWPFVRKQFQ